MALNSANVLLQEITNHLKHPTIGDKNEKTYTSSDCCITDVDNINHGSLNSQSIGHESTLSLETDFDSEASGKNSTYHYTYGSAIENMKYGDIGLVCFPVQRRVQVFRTGSNFTIMNVGRSGVGKTSFINSLFETELFENDHEVACALKQNPAKTSKITLHKLELIEDEFHLKFNIVDCPGFGDQIDNRNCWYPAARYIDEQYRKAVYQENQPSRSNMDCTKVHACLYFITPSAIGLSDLDIEAMKNLSARVNLIPIISKADGFTYEELETFKQKVKSKMEEKEIPICELIESTSKAKKLISEMPFSIINSIKKHKNGKGDLVRGRKYKWGVAEVENPNHCDFVKLKKFLIEAHMGDLISSTENYYEKYRKDFMKYRLGKAIQVTLSKEELLKLGAENFDKDAIVPNSRSSWKSTYERATGQVNLDALIESKDSIEVLRVLNRLSLRETEKEMVELNPSYIELERQVKKKFASIVHNQNSKFKDWKMNLFDKQDKFNRDIEQIHNRFVALQEEIRELES